MKIKKTDGISGSRGTGKTAEKPAASPQPADKPAPAEIEDKVSLSVDALGATKASAVKEVSEQTQAQGALPDPKKTAQKILEKELEKVFRETYL